MSKVDWCGRINQHIRAGGGATTWSLTPEETADCRAWLVSLGDNRDDVGTRRELLRISVLLDGVERGPVVLEAAQ